MFSGEAFNASFVKLPFANSNEQLSLYVFMPLEKTPTALDDFLYDLKMLKNFNEVFEIDTKDEISVELPRFTAESRFRHALNFGHVSLLVINTKCVCFVFNLNGECNKY